MAYRRTEQAEPHGGGGQGLLAFGAVLLAGLVFAVGAIALLMSSSPEPTRSPVFGGNVEPTSSLAIFEPETPTPTALPSFTPLPSYALFTPTPALSIVVPSFNTLPPPPSQTATPQPTPTRTDRPTPTPTVEPTPEPTPVNCAAADGSNTRSVVIGYGNPESTGAIPRAWCIHRVIFRPFVEGPFESPSTGEPGRTRLLQDGQRVAADTCSAEECNDTTREFSPPRLVPAGATLSYEFTCIDNPGTPESDECTDPFPGGATIEIQYEPLRGT